MKMDTSKVLRLPRKMQVIFWKPRKSIASVTQNDFQRFIRKCLGWQLQGYSLPSNVYPCMVWTGRSGLESRPLGLIQVCWPSWPRGQWQIWPKSSPNFERSKKNWFARNDCSLTLHSALIEKTRKEWKCLLGVDAQQGLNEQIPGRILGVQRKTQSHNIACLHVWVHSKNCLSRRRNFSWEKMRSLRPKRKTYQNLGLWQSPSRPPGRPATLPTVVWSPERLGFEGNGVAVSVEFTMAGLYGLPSHSTKFPQNKLLDSQRLCLAAVKHSS